LKSITIILLSLFVAGFFISDAYAYLDPGTGSVFIQAIIGALVGIGITLKIYWYKIKEKVSRISKKE
jgi:prepilin signal peptidase PulO-like enzyme (type II secretory pathway)